MGQVNENQEAMTQENIEQLLNEAMQNIDLSVITKYADGFTVNKESIPDGMYDENLTSLILGFFAGMRYTLENLQRED